MELTISDNGIKHATVDLAPGAVADIKDQGIQNPSLEPVLLAVGLDAGLAFTSDLSSVDIAAHSHGSKMGTGHQEGSCSNKGVVHKLAGPTQGLVGHDQRQLGIHGCVANVFPLLDVELVDQLALSVSNLWEGYP